MYFVYWIRYKNHLDPYNDGYIGISKNPLKRFKEHKNSKDNNKVKGAIKNGAIIEIICNGLSLIEALEMEKSYRPKELIGWNLCEGGQLPPSKNGKKYKEGKQILKGENRTNKQKEASKNHSKKMKGNIPWNKGKSGFTGPVKPCIYKGIEFNSRTEAASHFGVSVSAVTLWIKKNQSNIQAGFN
jgi:predicted GIY-YIG superfamily endonuclease